MYPAGARALRKVLLRMANRGWRNDLGDRRWRLVAISKVRWLMVALLPVRHKHRFTQRLCQLLPGKWSLFAKVAGCNGQVVDIHLAIAVDVNRRIG